MSCILIAGLTVLQIIRRLELPRLHLGAIVEFGVGHSAIGARIVHGVEQLVAKLLAIIDILEDVEEVEQGPEAEPAHQVVAEVVLHVRLHLLRVDLLRRLHEVAEMLLRLRHEVAVPGDGGAGHALQLDGPVGAAAENQAVVRDVGPVEVALFHHLVDPLVEVETALAEPVKQLARRPRRR